MTRDSIDSIRERTLENELAARMERERDDLDECAHCERRTNNDARCAECGGGPYCRRCVTKDVQCRRCNMAIGRGEA